MAGRGSQASEVDCFSRKPHLEGDSSWVWETVPGGGGRGLLAIPQVSTVLVTVADSASGGLLQPYQCTKPMPGSKGVEL